MRSIWTEIRVVRRVHVAGGGGSASPIKVRTWWDNHPLFRSCIPFVWTGGAFYFPVSLRHRLAGWWQQEYEGGFATQCCLLLFLLFNNINFISILSRIDFHPVPNTKKSTACTSSPGRRIQSKRVPLKFVSWVFWVYDLIHQKTIHTTIHCFQFNDRNDLMAFRLSPREAYLWINLRPSNFTLCFESSLNFFNVMQ